MEHKLKGKPQNSSVPSISVRFHANEEQLEDSYGSDEEKKFDETDDSSFGLTTNSSAGEPDSSPLKYLPRLVKRSTSIDITSTQTNLDASPSSSDPWRFFSDIKGKITKSVEDKITEIKSRNQEESVKNNKDKNSKESSSHSDSEDLSESSISKTCGILSTTEGAEMSSDDETPSINISKKSPRHTAGTMTSGNELRQRFRVFSKTKKPPLEDALPPEAEVEDAVDALEENYQDTQVENVLLKGIQRDYANIVLDQENVLNIAPVTGDEIRNQPNDSRIVYSPVGFVDMREKQTTQKSNFIKSIISLLAGGVIYYLLHNYSSYLAGMLVGLFLSSVYFGIKSLLDTPTKQFPTTKTLFDIVEVQAVKEYRPLTKYEGWMNELPEDYDPLIYHISQTQSVFIRLQGNFLKISNTKAKIPKRAMWNEPAHLKPTFTNHRVYNLVGAKITIPPEGLAKKRCWSKKYPICITLNNEQVNCDEAHGPSVKEEIVEESEKTTSKIAQPKRTFGFRKKKAASRPIVCQRYSKLAEENEFDMDTDQSGESSPSISSPDISEDQVQVLDEKSEKAIEEALQSNLRNKDDDEDLPHHMEDELESLPDDWSACCGVEKCSPNETKLYLFGRTGRDKEDWFRRFVFATQKEASVPLNETLDIGANDFLIKNSLVENEYMKFMFRFNKIHNMKHRAAHKKLSPETPIDVINDDPNPTEESQMCDLQWVNVLCGRILFDCLRDDSFTAQIRERLQKKLAAIKLPYFIEGLIIKDFNLGSTSPFIRKAGKPVIDDRGLWIDLDITYEGSIYLILQTKLNLMKLKYPPSQETSKPSEKSAIFHSDVEDSAESTSDEETMNLMPNVSPSDSSAVPASGVGGSSNTSKKFIKMVDKIAESKFFQAATEYRYIKKAMEGVSNTELSLRVDIKELIGTLVLNIPTPPSDRIWVGFRPIPEVGLSAQPIVGEKNITFMRITSWIEKKLLLEFQKLLVIPNMEDFIIPVMNPMLPR